MNTRQVILAGLYLCLSGLVYADEPTPEQISLIRHWLSHTSETSIHQLRGASGNKVYLHKDGHKEAVYDEAGKIVKDGINDGSYNYAHPVEQPLKHFNRDILPWLLWGASRSDPTSVEERLEAYSRALGGGLGGAQAEPKRQFNDKKIDNTEVQVVAFFIRVIEEGGVQEVFKILKNPEYEPKEPSKIGKGLTIGLSKVVSSGDFQPVKPD